ncbi:hypothetical protein KJ865_14970, partial [Myxococcota bacterium]|nr:hypothetical protein [Myxococcota bacterium]
MANALYPLVMILLLSQVPILHEPFPDNLPDKVPLRSKKNNIDPDLSSNSSNASSDNIDPLKSYDDMDFKVEKLLKKLISRRDDSQRESNCMTLDTKTDTWTPPESQVKSLFDPSIFPNERVWVHDSVRLDNGRLTSFSTKQQLKRIPTTSIADPQSHRFFWGEFELKRQEGYLNLPSISPHMKIVDVVDDGSRELKYWKDGNDVFYIGPIRGRYGKQRIRVRVAAPESYFSLDVMPSFALPAREDFPGSESLLALATRTFGKSRDGREYLWAMITYFRSFAVKPLKPYKKGL